MLNSIRAYKRCGEIRWINNPGEAGTSKRWQNSEIKGLGKLNLILKIKKKKKSKFIIKTSTHPCVLSLKFRVWKGRSSFIWSNNSTKCHLCQGNGGDAAEHSTGRQGREKGKHRTAPQSLPLTFHHLQFSFLCSEIWHLHWQQLRVAVPCQATRHLSSHKFYQGTA